MSENTIEPQLAVVILAAGQGTRMKSTLPKVLHRIGGRPLLGHVLDTARALDPQSVLVVVRHERDLVADAVLGVASDVVVVDQDEVPGTGRAVEMAIAQVPDFTGDILVLSGDVPLLDDDTLVRLIRSHRESGAAATVLSAIVDDATGYGRVIRDSAGGVQRIVEQKDATEDEASVHEINAGVYVFQSAPLRAHISLVGTANAQGERYLTDVVALLRDSRLAVGVSQATDATAALGVNDRVQLSDAARILNARTVRRWQLEGAMILDPATTWIDVTATLAPRRDGPAEHAHPAGHDDRRGRHGRVPTRAWSTARSARTRRSPAPTRPSRSSAPAPRSARSPTCAPAPISASAARSARSSRRRTRRSASAARFRTSRTSATRRSARA